MTELVSLPRVRQRFVAPVGAVVSGLFGGLGVAVLLGQFAVLFPTLMTVVIGAVVGVVLGLAGVNIARRMAVARLNDRIGQAEALINSRAGMAPAAVGVMAPPVPTTAPQPMHRIPPEGAAAYTEPDASTPPAAWLDPDLPVEVVERWGDWAMVRCSNDWTAWVDGRVLQEVPQ